MKDHSAAAAIRRRLSAPLTAAWILTAVLATTSLVVWFLWVRGSAPLSPELDVLPWWAMALGFFVVESMVIHLHFRSESGTFSLLEVPLTLGLLFANPGPAVLAMLLGSLAGLALVRRQPLMKLVFNLANLALHYTVAFALLQALLAGRDPLSPVGWLAVIGATTVTAVLNFSTILLVIAITERQFHVRQAAVALSFALVMALANTVQALVAALLVVSEPWAMLLLICSAGVLFVAYRGYVSERQQRERVEFLYSSTRALREGGETGRAFDGFLAETASMFRASTVMLFLFPDSESGVAPAQFTLRDGTFDADAITESEDEAARSLAAAPEPVLIHRETTSKTLREWMVAQDLKEAMIGALPSERRVVGLLVVGDRLGNVATFTDSDLRLFSTLVEHAAVSLEKDQLGQALIQLRELGKELQHQAKYDGLTGMANRSTFSARLDELYLADNDDGCVIYIDLDDFKPVNDNYGHAAGDALLVEVATRIQLAIRRGDLAARLGGDEFAVVLSSAGEAEAIAQRLVGSLGAPFQIDGNDVRIGASVGLAHRYGATSSSELVRHADIALYAAKENGKGTVVTYGAHLLEDAARQQTLQSDLRRAVARNEMEVHYQPIVNLEDLSIVGAEALVRWRQPAGPLTLPGEFIHEAEESGLITSVDRLVRAEVLQKLQSFRDLDPEFFVSVNLSARHLLRPNLVDDIAADLRDSDAPPEAVFIELTESALADDIDGTVDRLSEIRALGPRLALDDFGTGHSSLSYLRTLPIDMLKIAQPFIHNLAAGDATFVSAIIDLGQKLGFTVLAEGVEEQNAVHLLKTMSCDLGQGYHFARPMAFGELMELIERRRTEVSAGMIPQTYLRPSPQPHRST